MESVKTEKLRRLQWATEQAIDRGIERHRRQIAILQARRKRLRDEDWGAEDERKARGA